MRTVAFSKILRRTAGLIGVTLDQITSDDWSKICTFFHGRLQTGWHAEAWPDLKRLEQRFFRDAWAFSTKYARGDEVYDAASQKYFVCLPAASEGNPPEANPSWWAELGDSTTAEDWMSDYDYVAGDRVWYAPTQQFYACYLAHTSSEVLTPSSTSRWGAVPPFQRILDRDQTGKTPIGVVLGIYQANPRITLPPRSVEFNLVENGVLVREGTFVWVEFMLRPPTILGPIFDPLAVYQVGDEVYWTSSAAVGNFYVCAATTTAGQTPVSHATKWILQEIPEILSSYLAVGAYVDWLTMDGQQDKSGIWEKKATEELERAIEQVYSMQSQSAVIRMQF